MAQGKADYENIKIPTNKPKSEWTYNERRAFLYRRVNELGGVQPLNRTEMAEKFDVSIASISKDMTKYVIPYIAKHIDEEKAKANIEACFNRLYNELLEDGETARAFNKLRDYIQTLQKMGIFEREPEKLDISGMDIKIEKYEGEDEEGDE